MPCAPVSAAGGWRVEAGVGVEAAHQGVPAAGAVLGRLRGAGALPHEPRQERLVLGVVVPVGDLDADGCRALLEGVGALGEADPYDRVAGFQVAGAAVLRRGGGLPGLYGVGAERVIGPFGDLVAEPVDVLYCPGGDRVEEAGGEVGRPGEGLHWLAAVAMG